jgi:hypothetical protein
MSAQLSKPKIRAAFNRLVHGSFFPLDKMEQCDCCHRLYSLRKVTLVGRKLLCETCHEAEESLTPATGAAADPRLWQGDQ